MDLHSTQMQGLFDVPVDNLTSDPAIAKFILGRLGECATDCVIVAKSTTLAKRCA